MEFLPDALEDNAFHLKPDSTLTLGYDRQSTLKQILDQSYVKQSTDGGSTYTRVDCDFDSIFPYIDSMSIDGDSGEWTDFVTKMTNESTITFRVWNGNHTDLSNFRVMGFFNATVKTPDPVVTSFDLSNLTLYAFGTFPFSVAEIPVAVKWGGMFRVYSFSGTVFADDTHFGAQLVNQTYDNRNWATIANFPIDGKTPVDNTIATNFLSSVFNGGTNMTRLAITLKSPFTGAEVNAADYSKSPTVIIAPCYGITSFSIEDEYKLKTEKVGSIGATITTFCKITFKKTNSDTDTIGFGTLCHLMSFASSIYRFTTNAFERLENGINTIGVEVRKSSNGYDAEVSKAMDFDHFTIQIGSQSSEPKTMDLGIVSGTLASLGLQSTETVEGKLLLSNLQTVPYFDPSKEKHFIVDTSITRVVNGKRIINTTYDNIDAKRLYIYGYLDDSEGTKSNGKVVLFDSWQGEYDGQSNILVKYPCYTAGSSDIIDKCRFGILFGTSNAKNRLFVSGNPDKKNFDWHTGDDGIDGDFSYFPDTSEFSYGQDDNAVAGYGIVSDGTLFVSKTHSDKESTVYYRRGTMATLADDNGNIVSFNGQTIMSESYPYTKSNSRIPGVKPYLFTDFNGDSLFVTPKEGIFGLDYIGETHDNKRIASTRSYSINSEITETDPTKCFLFSDGTKLYYSTPDRTYISDYDLNRAREVYEWFPTDIGRICSFAHTINDRLDRTFFGMADGKVMTWADDWQDERGQYIVNGTEWVASGSTIKLTSSVGALVANGTYTMAQITGAFPLKPGHATTPLEVNSDGMIVDPDLSLDETNTFEAITGSEDIFFRAKLDHIGEDGITRYWKPCNHLSPEEAVTIAQGTWDIRIMLPNSVQDIELVSDNTIILKEYPTTDYASLISEKGITLLGRKPVSSYFITAPLITDAPDMYKTIWSFNVVWDTPDTSEVGVAVATNEQSVDKAVNIVNTNNGNFNYGSFSYNSINMQKKRLPHGYAYTQPFAAPFFSLVMLSGGNSDSVLTQVSFTYSFSNNRYSGESRS